MNVLRVRGHLALLYAALALSMAAGADDVRQVDLQTKDILYDPGTKKIYASVPGTGGVRANSITTIDPVTGTIGPSVYIGSEPGRLALSDRSKYLWVALDGSNSVRRFDLATQTAGPQTSLGIDTRAQDLAAVPGDPEALLIARTGTDYTLAVYKDGAQLPRPAPGGNSITVSPFGPRVYGYTNSHTGFELTTLVLRPDGIERVNERGGVIYGFQSIRGANGLIYTDNGKVVDPEAKAQVGEFPGVGGDPAMVIDAAVGRAFIITDAKLRAFDLRTFAEVGSMPLTGFRGGVHRVVRWGTDGIAVGTREGRVYLIRTSLVPPRKPMVDLTVSRTPLPSTLQHGTAVSYTLTVKNVGTVPATGVSLTDDISRDVDVLDVKASKGNATAVEGVLHADVGSLAPGASVMLSVRVQPAQGKTGLVTPTAIARSNEVDSAPANNMAVQQIQLAPMLPAPPSGPAKPQPVAQPTIKLSGVDLTGVWISATQSTRGAGVDLQATLDGVFVVRNAGTAAAPATRLRFLLTYTAGPGRREVLLQEVEVPALARGKTYSAHLHANLAKGDSAIGDVVSAVVDALKVTKDANRGNNSVRSKPIP